MNRCQWSQLNKQQVGAFAEYYVKMELTRYGLQVYSPEVDDRGIDLVVRNDFGIFHLIQVKSVRQYGYMYLSKTTFHPDDPTMHLALAVLFDDKEPELFLIPAEVWKTPTDLFKDRDTPTYSEWGLNISKKSRDELEKYKFSERIEDLLRQ